MLPSGRVSNPWDEEQSSQLISSIIESSIICREAVPPALESWRPPNTSVRPQRRPGVRGVRPWSWNTFGFWTFAENRKFAHFKKISNAKISDTISVLFSKKWRLQAPIRHRLLYSNEKWKTCRLWVNFLHVYSFYIINIFWKKKIFTLSMRPLSIREPPTGRRIRGALPPALPRSKEHTTPDDIVCRRRYNERSTSLPK